MLLIDFPPTGSLLIYTSPYILDISSTKKYRKLLCNLQLRLTTRYITVSKLPLLTLSAVLLNSRVIGQNHEPRLVNSLNTPEPEIHRAAVVEPEEILELSGDLRELDTLRKQQRILFGNVLFSNSWQKIS